MPEELVPAQEASPVDELRANLEPDINQSTDSYGHDFDDKKSDIVRIEITESAETEQIDLEFKGNTPLRSRIREIDKFVATAGFFALIIGILGLTDAIIMMPYFGPSAISWHDGQPRILSLGPWAEWWADDNVDSRLRRGPLHLSKNSDSTMVPALVSLILFGAAAGVAWMSAARAVFRVVSIDTNEWFLKGVRPRDLRDIFELRVPTISWTRWRLKLWRSSLFGLLCFALYVSVALLYRMALNPRRYAEVVKHDDFPGLYLNDTFSGHEYYKADLGIKNLVAMPKEASKPSSEMWNVELAWRKNWRLEEGARMAASIGIVMPEIKLKVKSLGTNFVVISQISTEEPQAEVAAVRTHPQCGPLMHACKRRNDDKTCFWMGLGLSNTTIQSLFSSRYVEEDSALLSSSEMAEITDVKDTSNCPVSLDSTIYSETVNNTVWKEYWDRWARNSGKVYSLVTPFSAFLRRLNHAPEMILPEGKTMLKNKGLMYPCWDVENPESSRVSGACVQYNLEAEVVSTRLFSAELELAASILLMAWSFLLLGAAWPYRRLAIVGTIDQWLLLGAEIGKECTGALNVIGNKKLRLHAQKDVDGEQKVFLSSWR